MANLKTSRSQYGGSIYDQQYFTDDELRRAAEIRQAAERGETDWDSAHNLVEAIRGKYGYSGGTNGAGYTALKQAASETPTYISEFKDEIASLKNALLNRPAFSYDYQSDPAYQSYKKQYTREGQRATADTLGQLAAMTGGMPSTAATAAAAQQANYYGAKIADVIPELRSLAYQMYQAEGDDIRNNLSTLLKMDSQAQDLYKYNADRSDQNRQQAVSDAQKRIETYLMMGGSVAGIDAATKAAAGYTDAELNQMEAYYKQQAALAASKGSGSGSTKKTETAEAATPTMSNTLLTESEFNRYKGTARGESLGINRYGNYATYKAAYNAQQRQNKIAASKAPAYSSDIQDKVIKYAEDGNTTAALSYLANQNITAQQLIEYARAAGISGEEIEQYLDSHGY